MKTAADTRLRMRCGRINGQDRDDLLDDFAELEAKLALAMKVIRAARQDGSPWIVTYIDTVLAEIEAMK